MSHEFGRREFLASSAAVGMGILATRHLAAAPFKTKLHKAMIMGTPTENRLKQLKDAGWAGIESNAWNMPPDKAKMVRELVEKHGIKIHSVLRGWTNFNNDKAVAKDIASVETALKACQGYGADALLLVPCRTGNMPMPKPWEFDITFDEKTGHVKTVAKGDNAQYAKYIEAQNQATDMSRAALQKLIPVAEKTGVKIALENVWNNLWVKPDLFTNFVASFKSPWVGAYFDVGNHVKYAPPEQWIPKLGNLLLKIHIKDFKLNENGQGGKFCKVGEGSVDWPAVRKALDDVGYNGWLTNESGGFSLEELGRRFDLIIAGKDPGERG